MSIAQNTALFSILGTTYGGNGQTTFALPDLRGRVPMHTGAGPGLSSRQLGQMGGTETVSLNVNQLPAHSHSMNAYSEAGAVTTPKGTLLANTGLGDNEFRDSGTLVAMHGQAIGNTGGGQPVSIVQPYLVLNYLIALNGIYPSRN